MKKYLLLLLLLPMVANAQIYPAKLNTNATVPIPIYYAATPWIVFSTPTVDQLSCSLIKPDGTRKYFNVAATGDYRLSTSTKGDKWIGVGIPAAEFASLGAHTLVVNASFSQQWARGIMVYDTNAYSEVTHGIGAKIASATQMIVDHHVSTRSMIGRWAKNATDTTISARDIVGNWIVDSSPTIAPPDVIPASGTTLPQFSGQWDGDIGRSWLMGFAFSRSEDEPEFVCRIVQDDGVGVPLIYESAFSHAVYPYNVAILGATVYIHGWSADISGIPLNMQFSVLCAVERNGQAIAGSSKLIKNPTPEVTFPTVYGDRLDDIITSLQAVRLSSDPHEIYKVPNGLTRAVPGESSINSRYVPAGEVYAIVKRALNPVSGLVEEVTQVIDYDSVTNGRGPYYSIPSLQAQIIIDGVSPVIKAGKEDGI